MHYLALFSLLVAGSVHLAITPTHYAHATAHGVFFISLGLMQIAWAIAFWRWPKLEIAWAGLPLSGGVVVLWILAHNLGTPFGGHNAIDWAAVVTKTAEAIGCLFLLIYIYQHHKRSRLPQFTSTSLGLCLGVGLLLWGGGRLAEPILPQWAHTHSHSHQEDDHDHATHNHSEQDAHHNHTAHNHSDQDTHQEHTTHEHGNHQHPQSEDSGPATVSQVASTELTVETESAYDWNLPPGFPPPRVPENNPMTTKKVELGRYLFYDERLSGNNTQSCSSCHLQELAFSDGEATPIGSTGEQHPRNSQALVNVVYNSTLTWANPALIELERQIQVPMFGEFPKELGIVGHEEEVLARLEADETYQQLFVAAFPDEKKPINFQNIIKSLASFTRALISGNSPYDRYVYLGDKTALSESAKRGLNLFLSERLECHHCHIGFNFSASTIHANSTFIETPFQNNGLYNLDGQGSYPRSNTGLHHVTGNPDDMGKFRPPTLRNIELTGPYMHDGTIETLEEVIDHYADGGRLIETGEYAGDGTKNPHKSGLVSGFELTDQEKEDLINFLESLTDETFIHDPRFSNPFE